MIKIDISPYCKIIKRNSKDTLVFFSAIDTPKGKFSFYTIGMNSQSNIIFLNTHNKNWYYDGVPGLGMDHLSTIEALNKLIDSLKSTNITFVGGSMGGYGALMYGALIESVTNIISFGAELDLGIKGGIAEKVLLAGYEHYNIYKLIKNNPKKYYFIMGENCETDMIGAAKLYKEKLGYVSIYTLKNLMHALVPYLDSKYGIESIIGNILNKTYIYPFDEEEKGEMYKHLDLVLLIYKVRNSIPLELDDILLWEGHSHEYNDYLKSYIFHALGEELLRKKEYLRAQDFFYKSAELNLDNIFFQYKIIEQKTVNLKKGYTLIKIKKGLDILDLYDIQKAKQGEYRSIIKKVLKFLLKRKKARKVLKFFYTHDLYALYRDEYMDALKIESNVMVTRKELKEKED